MQNLPFVDKYEPTNLDEFLWWNDDVRDVVETFTIGKRMDNIYLYGPPGTGKSLLAKLLPEAIMEDRYRRDAVVNLTAYTTAKRAKVINDMNEFFKMCMLPGVEPDRRLVIINEVGDLPKAQVELMKNVFDKLNRLDPPVFVITTTNDPIKAFPVVRRGTSILLDYPSSEKLIEHGKHILSQEGETLPDQVIETCVEESQRSIALFLKLLEGAVWLKRLQGARKPGANRKNAPVSLRKIEEKEAQQQKAAS